MSSSHGRPVLFMGILVASLAAAVCAHAQVFVHVAPLTHAPPVLPASVTLQQTFSGENLGGLPLLDMAAPFAGEHAAAPSALVPDGEADVRISPQPRPFTRLTAPVHIFGGVEIGVGKTVLSHKWTNVLGDQASRYFANECEGPGAVCDASSTRRIAEAIEAARSEPPRKAIQRINAAVNRALRFTEDLDQYGVRDYWAKPSESLRSGRGDCEDYAILKYWALKTLGVPEEAMRLVIVRDVRRGLDHAVLAVSDNGDNLILDSLFNEVRSDASLRNYEPRISFGSEGAWLHGRMRPQIARAQIASVGEAR